MAERASRELDMSDATRETVGDFVRCLWVGGLHVNVAGLFRGRDAQLRALKRGSKMHFSKMHFGKTLRVFRCIGTDFCK